MDFNLDGQRRLDGFFSVIGATLGSDSRRASFAVYAMGMLSDAERKSVEPLAAHRMLDPKRVDAEHQRMLHFLNEVPWSNTDVRLASTRYALESMTARGKVNAWIVDDTGFMKQGKHSVGVQRQYTGTVGKVANCQIGVSLSVATSGDHLPIDFELYLPERWAGVETQRAKARIPGEVQFKTKPELAIQMIRRAVAAGIPQGVVLADAAYGSSKEFRAELRELELEYAVAVNSTTRVQLLDKRGNPDGPRKSVGALAKHYKAAGQLQPHAWREGTRGTLKAQFLRRTVEVSKHETATLLVEWRDGDSEPANCFLVFMKDPPATVQLVRIVMQRWRTERAYEDLKGELGLDHFEGRSFPGWHHHVSVVLACYAFIVAERNRRFFSTTGRPVSYSTHRFTAGSPLPGQLHHSEACDCEIHQQLAAEMPLMPPLGDEASEVMQ